MHVVLEEVCKDFVKHKHFLSAFKIILQHRDSFSYLQKLNIV